WRPEDALRADVDLTRTTLAGNLVPATQGTKVTERFAIRQAPPLPVAMPAAVERTGPNGAPELPVPQFLHTLLAGRLVVLSSPDDPTASPLPEIALSQPPVAPATKPTRWTWRRRLLDAEPFEQA